MTADPRDTGTLAAAPAPAGVEQLPTRVERILSGAASVFSRHGFAATSMRQIASATDTSLGAIYYHFDGKESILRAIISGNFRRVHESLSRRLAGIEEPRVAFEAFVENHIEFFAHHLDEMRVMSHELDTLTGEAGEEVAALRRAYTEEARETLAALRPDLSDDELQVALLCLFGMLNWTYRWYHTVEPRTTPHKLARQMVALYLGGFLSEGSSDT